MKKILVCVDSFEVGGVTEVIKRIYHNINKNKFQMDFMAVRRLNNDTEKEIVDNGDKIYYLTMPALKSVPYFNYIIRDFYMVKQIKKLIKDEEYVAAYIHAHGNFYLPATKIINIPIRVYHVHEGISDFNGNENKSFITSKLWKKRQKMYNKLSTAKVGDSAKACVAKFGVNTTNDPLMEVLYPSVDMEKFNTSSYNEEDIKCFNINPDSFNMIHVGRLNPVKNQKFLIDILSEIIKIKDSHLHIIGEGDRDKQMLIAYAKEKGVTDKVTFLKGDTSPAIYKAMDCSLLPSFSEAFGMVAVESQLMGVPCFASTNVPTDVDAGICTFLDLEKGAKSWAEAILHYDYANAKINNEKIKEFDIKNIVKRLETIFDN